MEKKHISLWVDEDVLGLCDSYLKMSKLKNRGEFVQEAIRLYCGYLENQIRVLSEIWRDECPA